MSLSKVDIHEYMKPGVRVHLAGIGGVSMCPLAEVLQGMGLQVQGSDMNESATVRHLRELGIHVDIGHSAENLRGCDLVIRTAAIHNENPEIAGAITRGIPVYERAEAWGAIMRQYQNALCIFAKVSLHWIVCVLRAGHRICDLAVVLAVGKLVLIPSGFLLHAILNICADVGVVFESHAFAENAALVGAKFISQQPISVRALRGGGDQFAVCVNLSRCAGGVFDAYARLCVIDDGFLKINSLAVDVFQKFCLADGLVALCDLIADKLIDIDPFDLFGSYALATEYLCKVGKRDLIALHFADHFS